jgi:phosphohistidine phosphatase SixA
MTSFACRLKSFSLVLALCVLLPACVTSPADQNQAKTQDAVYYLVRHAEKQLKVKNPPLTAEGKQRAQDLADLLSNTPLTAIYSTDYIRTQQTAAPVAKAKGLMVQSYDPRDLPSFAKKLLSNDGHTLVSGHSNTTPQLAELMGADPGAPIIEATEYNRIYIIERSGNTVTGRIETFGK